MHGSHTTIIFLNPGEYCIRSNVRLLHPDDKAKKKRTNIIFKYNIFAKSVFFYPMFCTIWINPDTFLLQNNCVVGNTRPCAVCQYFKPGSCAGVSVGWLDTGLFWYLKTSSAEGREAVGTHNAEGCSCIHWSLSPALSSTDGEVYLIGCCLSLQMS